MSVLDSTMKDMMRLASEEAEVFEVTSRSVRPMTMAPEAAAAAEPAIPILVKFAGDVAELEKAGLRVRTIAGNVITGDVIIKCVDKLTAVHGVQRIEAARPMWRELNISRTEVRANLVHAGPPANLGAGCLIGIIDSGIDYSHGSFRTASGQTRIRFLWDQSLTPQGTEASPVGFGFGVEYTQTQINAALAAPVPFNVVRHRDTDSVVGHGTHVAGIAAGDGSDPGGGFPANTFIGMAPGAELIVVTNAVTTEAIGDSASTLDAARYILEKASALGRPVAINMSQGDNIGPHDGTSLLEEGIDNLLGGSGRCMVKSAGNEGAAGRHAMGTVAAGASETVRFVVDPGDTSREIVDIWYPAADRFAFQITPPGGALSAVVSPGTTNTLNLPGGNSVFVDSVVGAPSGSGDNRIFFTLTRGTAVTLQAGTWSFTLTGTTVTSGAFHAWIERGNLNSTSEFNGVHRTNSHTISIPGTAREIITVGSYINTGAGAGSLSGFSSRGPTRDGRQAPTLCGHGENVTAPRARDIAFGSGLYHQISGTSMSAPHVAGVGALILTRHPGMTQTQVQTCLRNAARADMFTGPGPNNNDWGRGKLDAQASVACADRDRPNGAEMPPE